MKRNFTEQDLKLMQERIAENRGKTITLKNMGAAPVIITNEPTRKKNKYSNIKVETSDGSFDSRKEHEHFLILKNRITAGLVTKIERQVVFDLHVNGILICRYVADFVVHNVGRGVDVVDVKSDITRKNRAYRIKYKLMQAVHNITILEV
jgi:hypothetical protein